MGSSIIIATAVQGRVASGGDFMPLTVEFLEKSYASGRIPGGVRRDRESVWAPAPPGGAS